MEINTSARRGRKRKDSSTGETSGSSEAPSSNDIREREIGRDGQSIPSISDGESAGCSFAELVEIVRKKNSHDHRISCVIHPEADGVIQTDNLGNIRTEKGSIGYQLNTGEIIAFNKM